jgi:hypothetical protein
MLRESLQKHLIGMNKEFRFRGEEPGRLENFSDACFALAITLLLISTSPPSNFAQVKKFAWEVIPFAICITLIVLIWHQHFIFFFRYGLRNSRVIVLNTIFLILVLFYVYPLKFLAKAILVPLTKLFGADEFHSELLTIYGQNNLGDLMIIYGIGATLIFVVLALFYRHALLSKTELGLDEIETFDTKSSMRANYLMALVPLLSVLVSAVFSNSRWGGFLGGMTYFLYSPIMSIFWRRNNKKRKLLIQSSEPEDLLQYP